MRKSFKVPAEEFWTDAGTGGQAAKFFVRIPESYAMHLAALRPMSRNAARKSRCLPSRNRSLGPSSRLRPSLKPHSALLPGSSCTLRGGTPAGRWQQALQHIHKHPRCISSKTSRTRHCEEERLCMVDQSVFFA